ncbi:MAG: hypothetical protein SH819_15105 [Cytophagales bacterium]|nr:hypothetical protein [Cytophagales bacterium]
MNNVAKILVVMLSGLSLAFGQTEERGTISSLVERGDHQNGMRVGIWEYYDHPRELSLVVDYDQGKLLYVRPDTSHFYVRDGDRWSRSRLAVPCRFSGSLTNLIDHYDLFRVPVPLRKEKKYFSVWLTFHVGPGGLATNPEVHDDPGYGVKEHLLELFEHAPNSWITGVGVDEKLVTSLMAIRFDYCEPCESKPNFPAKVLFTGDNPRRAGPWGGIHPLFSFSPDNRKLLFVPKTVGLNTSKPGDRAVIVDLETRSMEPLPFDHSGGFWWMDNDQILFMPKYYSRTPTVLAKLELSKNKVTILTDSVTSLHLMSPDHRRIAFMTVSNGRQYLSCIDLATGSSTVLAQCPTWAMPERWSPDGKQIVFSHSDGGFQKYTLVNIESGEKRPLPVMNAKVCGWSSDGNVIFQLRTTRDEYKYSNKHESHTPGIVSVQTITTTTYEPISELIETNLLAGSPRILMKKGKNIRVSYSASKDMFLLMMDDNAYLKRTDPNAKPVRIIEKCSVAEWSDDGEYIAYISARDQQLHLYTVATRKSGFLTLAGAETQPGR